MSYAVNRGKNRAKLSPQTQEQKRAKIDVDMCLTKLNACVRGEIELRSDQLQSAKLLLERSLPSLVSQEIAQTQTNYVARLPAPAATADAWLEQIASENAKEGQGPAIASSPVVDGTKH